MPGAGGSSGAGFAGSFNLVGFEPVTPVLNIQPSKKEGFPWWLLILVALVLLALSRKRRKR